MTTSNFVRLTRIALVGGVILGAPGTILIVWAVVTGSARETNQPASLLGMAFMSSTLFGLVLLLFGVSLWIAGRFSK